MADPVGLALPGPTAITPVISSTRLSFIPKRYQVLAPVGPMTAAEQGFTSRSCPAIGDNDSPHSQAGPYHHRFESESTPAFAPLRHPKLDPLATPPCACSGERPISTEGFWYHRAPVSPLLPALPGSAASQSVWLISGGRNAGYSGK